MSDLCVEGPGLAAVADDATERPWVAAAHLLESRMAREAQLALTGRGDVDGDHAAPGRRTVGSLSRSHVIAAPGRAPLA